MNKRLNKLTNWIDNKQIKQNCTIYMIWWVKWFWIDDLNSKLGFIVMNNSKDNEILGIQAIPWIHLITILPEWENPRKKPWHRDKPRIKMKSVDLPHILVGNTEISLKIMMIQRFQTINCLTRPILFIPTIPHIWLNQAQRGGNKVSTSPLFHPKPQEEDNTRCLDRTLWLKQKEKWERLKKRISWKPRLSF